VYIRERLQVIVRTRSIQTDLSRHTSHNNRTELKVTKVKL